MKQQRYSKRSWLIPIIVVALAVLGSVDSSRGQQDSQLTNSAVRIVALPADKVDVSHPANDSDNQLRNQLPLLGTMLNEPFGRDPLAPPQEVGGMLLSSPDDILDQVVDFDRDTSSRLNELQRKLHSLITRQMAQQARPQEELAPAQDSTSENQSAATDTSETTVLDTPPDIVDVSGDPQMNSIRLLNQPVDKLAMADNLTKSGQIELALEIYQQLPVATYDEADRRWVRYQIANCHRQLGKYDEAEKIFREITDLGDNEFPVPLARWWLSVLPQQKMLDAKSRQFEKIIQEQEQIIANSQ